MPIPPNRLQIQCIAYVLQRIAFNEHQIRFAALSNQPAIMEPEPFRVQTSDRAKRFLRGEAGFVHEEVQFVVN